MKILVSAYACSPAQGSEPGVGWGFVRALSERHALHVIVESRFQGAIETFVREHPFDRIRCATFHFVDRRRRARLERFWPLEYYVTYREWHQKAYELAHTLHVREKFDLVHQLTMVGFREPGYLWRLDIPFVWGPIGGMGLFPWRFVGEVGLRGALHYIGYNLWNAAQMRWMRRPAEAAHRAAGGGLIAATRENLDGAERYWGVRGSLLSEVGLPRSPVQRVPVRQPGGPLRLVWSGLHTPGKALQLALRAIAEIPAESNWTLDVLGAGPMTRRWQELARRLRIDDRVRFHGWLERARALELMENSHAMLITSLRDLTSTVTVEALAFGLPVICPDHCGFADVVDEDCGIKVPVDSPGRMVEGIRQAVVRLAGDEAYRQRLAQGALRRAMDFDWDAKADAVDAVYRKAIPA